MRKYLPLLITIVLLGGSAWAEEGGPKKTYSRMTGIAANADFAVSEEGNCGTGEVEVGALQANKFEGTAVSRLRTLRVWTAYAKCGQEMSSFTATITLPQDLPIYPSGATINMPVSVVGALGDSITVVLHLNWTVTGKAVQNSAKRRFFDPGPPATLTRIIVKTWELPTTLSGSVEIDGTVFNIGEIYWQNIEAFSNAEMTVIK